MSFDLQLINDDISIQPDGKIRTVSATPKLRQDILKIIVTELGSNRFHPWYGCAINENVIGQSLPEGFLESEIVDSITESLNRLQTLQQQQALFQQVALSEIIASVGPIAAKRNPIDPRQINIVVTVFTRQLTKVEEVFTIIA